MHKVDKKVIIIAGGSGLVGTALLRHIDFDSYQVVILSRKSNAVTKAGVSYAQWNTDLQSIDYDGPIDVIINLAGAGIADALWTHARKKELVESRVKSSQTLEKFISKSTHKPSVYIGASAIGYYGHASDQWLYENSAVGTGFMADCCQKWEESSLLAGALCDRSVLLRIGIVLSTLDGALPKMIMTKNIGVYNYFGDGNQYYSWIHIDDLCRMTLQPITDSSMRGVYNAVSPEPYTHRAFMQLIMKGLDSSGMLLPVPRWTLRLAMGEMADVILNSNRVSSDKISAVFDFKHSDLSASVRDLVSRKI
jgi:uncharacterized protein